MRLKSTLTIAVPALLCGAVLGYFLHTPEPAANPAAAPTAHAAKKHAKVATDDEAALNRLRARVADLERQLAAARAPSEEPIAVPIEPGTNRPPEMAQDGRHHGPPNFGDFRKKLEELKTTDPDRYSRITNHMAQARQRHLEHAQNRLDLLASVDTSRMNPKQVAIHQQYQELLAQQEEMRDLMRPENMEQLTDEQRESAMKQMRDVDRQMRQLAKQEQNILLSQTALSYGIKGANASEFVETVKAVYQMTDKDNRGGMPPGGPGGPGGGPRN